MDKKKLKNEQGITLIEVIASIVILTVILVSIISLLPQMGLKNNQNEDKQEAINLAAKELAYWQGQLGSTSTFISLVTPGTTFPFMSSGDTLTYDTNTITITTTTTKSMPSKYNTVIKIKRKEDLASSPKKANQISVLLYKNNTILVTEIYGYIIY